MKGLLIALGLSSALIGAAQAGDLHKQRSVKDEPATVLPAPAAGGVKVINWTGFYVGGHAGYGNSNDKISGQGYQGKCATAVSSSPNNEAGCAALSDGVWSYDAIDKANAFVDGLNSHGGFIGARVGGDFGFDHWVVGAFGDYNLSSAKMKAGADSGAFSGSIEDGDSWVLALRAGYAFGEEKRALLYGLAGYGQQDVSYHGAISSDPAHPFNSDATFSGLVVGAGAEYALNNLVTVGIEWQHFMGGAENVFDDRGLGNCHATVVDDKRQSDKIMGRINFKAGPGLFGY